MVAARGDPQHRPAAELGWPGAGVSAEELARALGASRGRTTLPPIKNFVLQLCVVAIAGWINRGQQQVIESLEPLRSQDLDS